MSDQHTGYPGAPPGWYADPGGGAGQRWWDGYAWTDTVVTPSAPPPPPPYGMPAAPGTPPSGAQPWEAASNRMASANLNFMLAAESGALRAAVVAVFFVPATNLVNFIIEQANSAQFLADGDQWRTAWHAIQNNEPRQTFTTTVPLSWLSGLMTLLTIVALIMALVWQNRSAKVARGLGLPATHSPGWGVGCWFVPIVNFWMPYQAVRDCLPPGDPHRPLVLRWWLLFLGMQFVAAGAQVAAYFSHPVALGLGVPSILLALGVMATAPRMVTAITASHQALVNGPTAVARMGV